MSKLDSSRYIFVFASTGEFSRAKKALRQALHLAEVNQDEETLEMIKSSMMKLDVDTS